VGVKSHKPLLRLSLKAPFKGVLALKGRDWNGEKSEWKRKR